MKHLLLFLTTILLSFNGFGQGRWVNYTSQDALPSLNVRDILVDSQGNKWFATDNGLAMFDGENWTTYQPAYQSLQNSDIYELEEDKDGRIWIVTSTDIEVYDGENWTYYNENNTFPEGFFGDYYLKISIHVDNQNTVWIASRNTPGLYKFQNDNWEVIEKRNNVHLSYIDDIESDNEGNLWVSLIDGINNPEGYQRGIAKFNNNSIEIFTEDQLENSPLHHFTLIENQIWVRLNDKIIKYVNGNWQDVTLVPEQLNGQTLITTPDLLQDKNGIIWMRPAEESNTFLLYDTNTQTLTTKTFENAWNSSAFTIDEDQIWLCTQRNNFGVMKINTESFKSSKIGRTYGPSNYSYEIFVDQSNKTWVTHQETISVYDNNEWKTIQFSNASNFRKILEDNSGNIWFFSNNTAKVYNGENFSEYNSVNSPYANFKDADIDNNGDIYVTIDGGILKYNGDNWENITSEHESLNTANEIEIFQNGEIWVSISNGYAVKSNGQWTTIQDEPLYPSAPFTEGKNNSLWIAHWSNIYYHSEDEHHQHNLADTFPEGGSFSIIESDIQGGIWVLDTAPTLLARYKNGTWEAYDSVNVYDINSIYADSTGNVWFTTYNKGIKKLILFSERVLSNQTNISCHAGNNGTITFTPEGNNPPYHYSIDGGENYVTDSIFTELTAGGYHLKVLDGDAAIAHDEIITLIEPNGVFEWEVTAVSCNGVTDGAISLTVQNDGSPISFEWYDEEGSLLGTSQDISGLAGGTYSVSASYGECLVTKQIEIPEPAPLQATLNYLNVCGDDINGQISVITSGGTAPFSYSLNNGEIIQTEPTFENLNAGNYQVMIEDARGCTFVSDPVTIEAKEKPSPQITTSGELSICQGSSIWLSTDTSYETYNWYDLQGNLLSTESSLEVSQAGSYYVGVIQNQCLAYSDTITTNMVETYTDQQICVVTVDQATGKNKITWSKTAGLNISAFNVYKETGTNQYSLLGTVPYDSDSYFIDQESNPIQASERYKVSVVDDCGNESQLSEAHKTIYLQTGLDLNDNVTLSWDTYEGFDYAQVNILRGPSIEELGVISTRPSNNSTFTDTEPDANETIYVIEAVANYSCDGGTNTRTTESLAFTRSNPGTVEITLSTDPSLALSKQVKVYPNPAEKGFTVSLGKGNQYIRSVKLMDLSGRLIKEAKITGNKSLLHFESNARSGVYILEIWDTNNHVYRHKMIIK